MDDKKELRWKQRFENFENAYRTYERILAIKEPNEAERMGLIQAFEIVFELSWKTLKDYLSAQGYQESSPRSVLKQAFQDHIIANGHDWMDGLTSRNQTVHTYNHDMAIKLDAKIRDVYAPMIAALYVTLKDKYDGE